MAASKVSVTEGSGQDIDTRTETDTSRHRQVVVLGDPATTAGVAPVDATTGLKVNLGADNDVTITGAALTALQLIDNIVHVEDTPHTTGDAGVMMLGVENQDQANLTAGDKDYTPIAVSREGNIIVRMLDSLPAGDNNIGNVDIVSGIITTVTTLTGSSVAHDGVDAGNPHKIGGRSQEPTAQLEEVANDDRTDGAFDRQGRLAVWMGYPVQTAVINDDTLGNNTIQASAGAGLRIAVMGYHIIADGTTDIRWEDGANGGAFTGQIPLQEREGLTVGYGLQPMWVGSAATLLNLELTVNVRVHGQISFIVMTD